jgi:hypothetical protein
MQLRINHQLALALEQAVVIDALNGAATAWVFLTKLDVPKETIFRVLTDASIRRATDTPTALAIEKFGFSPRSG